MPSMDNQRTDCGSRSKRGGNCKARPRCFRCREASRNHRKSRKPTGTPEDCGSRALTGTACTRTPSCTRCKEANKRYRYGEPQGTPEDCGHTVAGGTACRQPTRCAACRRESKRYLSTPRHRATRLLGGARIRAKDLGVPFNLDADWIEARLAVGECEVTGLPFDSNGALKGKQKSPLTPSLDRKDPNKGYTKDNVQVVVWIHNAAKGSWDDEMVLIYAKAIVERLS